VNLTALFVRRPTLVTVFIALVLLAGTLSAFGLVKQQFPNYDVPTIQVLVTYPGASTTELRDAIVRPLEDQIAGAPNLQTIETAIQPGQATIVARYTLGSDVNSDLVQTQGRVQNAQRQLPSDLQTPQVSIYDPSQAVVVSLVASSSTLEPGALSSLVTNKIVPSLEQITGVSFVETNGAVTPSIQVNVDPKALSSAGLTLTDVTSTIASNNVRAPGGIAYSSNRETNIDIRGDVRDPASVADLLVSGGGAAAGTATNAFTQSARLFRIGDIARVSDTFEPQRVYAYTRGTQSIALDVQKATNTSEVNASNNILAALPGLRAQYPNVNFDVLNVQATYTKDVLSGVVRTLIEGIVFTGIVMLLFLRSWRNSIVVMVAIPTSLLVTLAAMKLANFTLDTVSLLAMTLIIGILVDDSIVVLENIERHAAGGEEPQLAAVRGRSEIGIAAIVITLVDVVVFLPISFLPGTVGLFLREFGLVVTVATLTSLFVSFTVTPSLAGRWSLYSTWRPWGIIDRFTLGFERLRDWYAHRALSWALRRQTLIIAISAISLVLALTLLPLGIVGFEYIPPIDRGEVFITVTYPNGTPLESTRQGVLAVERLVDRDPNVAAETALAGAYQGNLSGYINDGAIGQLHVFLQPGYKTDTNAWAAHIARAAQRAVPAASVVAIPATDTQGGIQQPIDEVITAVGSTASPDDYAARVADALQRAPGATNVTTTSTGNAPQVNVEFERDRARALGVSIGTASTTIRAAFGGVIATQFTGSSGLKDVQVIYPQTDQTNLSAIAAIPVRTNAGGLVHVGDIARLTQAPAPPLIARVNRRSVVYVGSNVAPGVALSNVQRAFERNLVRLRLPAAISVAPVVGGNQQNVTDTVVGMSLSLVLSIMLVYLLMVALYDSYRTPFVIMFSVPVAIVGALGALALTHQTLNLFSFIGSVLLIGLVSKNGILLVDFANRLRLQGRDREDAVRESALERVRPIVMTTLAMIAGMTPLALALDPGSQAERSLGTVVIGGLTSSLLLTLLLVPIIYLRFAPPPRKAQAASTDGQIPLPLERPLDVRA